MRILLTGASGFVGHHILDYLLLYTEHEVVCPVSWRHRGNQARWRYLMDAVLTPRVMLIGHDLTEAIDPITSKTIGHIDMIMNVASESHVDRSISDPRPFIENNTKLMLTMLEFARERADDLIGFLQMSTDEVYGPAAQGDRHFEWSTIRPSNPYSASKAAQEAIAFSYWRTYDLPVVITNTMNIFGPRQDAEKYPAMVMSKVSKGEVVPIHGRLIDPTGLLRTPWTPGSRFYLPAYNLAAAWTWLAELLAHKEARPRYSSRVNVGQPKPVRVNIVGEREVDNLEFAQMIAEAMGKELKYEFVDFHSSRPGHDLRYALEGSRLAAMGFRFPWTLQKGIEDMVEWYQSPDGRLWN